MAPIEVRETKKGLSFEVRVRPCAGRSAVVGEHAGALKVDLTAPPEGGKANKELVRLLAGLLGIPSGGVAVVSGETSRRKRVSVAGVDGPVLENFLKSVTKP